MKLVATCVFLLSLITSAFAQRPVASVLPRNCGVKIENIAETLKKQVPNAAIVSPVPCKIYDGYLSSAPLVEFLYIVDGIPVTTEELNTIKVENIISIDLKTYPRATATYCQHYDGIMLIKTKKKTL